MTPLRPSQHLSRIARAYPGCWQQVDTLRAQRGLGLPHWPEWCFLPLAGAVAVITRGIPDPPPAQPTTWEVASRLGATLRQAQQRERVEVQETDEASRRARPRPHIRRAHWHLYWTGTGRQTPRVRWLPPVLVGQEGEIVSTIHPVQ